MQWSETKEVLKSLIKKFGALKCGNNSLLFVLLCGVAVLTFGFPGALIAPAQVVTPFTPRFTANDKGAIVLTGNTLLTCPTSVPTCTPNGPGNNNSFNMIYVDVDSDLLTFNSSSAVIDLPAGAEVLFAGLYWGADTSAGTNGTAAPSPLLRTEVLLDTPAAGGYLLVVGSQVGIQGTRYHVFFDATNLVRAAGNGTYTIANLQAGTGADRYGGWSLVIAYRLADAPLRNLTVFDGYATVSSANNNISFDVSGFLTPPSGPVRTRLGTVVYEGDRQSTGDSLKLNNVVISNSLNPANNYFNSTVTELGVAIGGTKRTPGFSNLLGFDIDQTETPGVIPNGATSATIGLTTGSETYFPGVVTFTTDLYSPNIPIMKSAIDLNGGALQPGDTVEYRVSLQNVGNDAAIGIVFTDLIPLNTTYVPNSITVVSGANPGNKTDAPSDDQAEFVLLPSPRIVYRPGTGATGTTTGTMAPGEGNEVRFRVQVNPGTLGQQVTNQPSLTYTAQTSGLITNENPPIVVLQIPTPNSDLAITKSNGTDTVAVGSNTTYTIVVTNNGPDAANGATVTDSFPPFLTGVSWTCTPSPGAVCGSANGTGNINTTVNLPAGASATFTATATVDSSASGTLTNTASVEPPAGNGDSNPNNNSATDTDTLTPIADLAITKTNGVTQVRSNHPVTYTITVTNLGPDPVFGASVIDELPVDLIDATWTCTASSGSSCGVPPSGSGNIDTTVDLLSGGTATFTLTARVSLTAGNTLVNIATVAGPAGVTDSNQGNNSSTDTDTVLPPTAATALVNGRVLTANGRGLYNARVTMTNMSGQTRYSVTNPFGFYRFMEVQAGETYVFEVKDKRYVFSPQVLTIIDDIHEVNFIAEPRLELKTVY